MPKRFRTFIAVEISAQVRKRLVELQDKLASAAPDLKWVEPENLHLTLKFLGDVDEQDLYEVCKTAAAAVAADSPIEMTLAGIGAFPNARRPRVIWAGVSRGSQELTAIHQRIEHDFRELGYPREDRAFTPHLTIGRLRRVAPNPQFEQAILEQQSWEGGTTNVSEIRVMASQLTPDGPHYMVMGRGPLAGNG